MDELTPAGDDEVYFHDLIGLKVELANGDVVGEVTELYELPQGIILDVQRPNGVVVIPYSPEVVVGVDLERGVLTIDPPEGLIE